MSSIQRPEVPSGGGASVGGAGGDVGGLSSAMGAVSAIFAAVSFFGSFFGKGQQVGPRLKDLSINLDGEGLEIPKTWGVGWHDGRLVWTSGLVETKHSHGGGFFGALTGHPKTNNYTYSAKAVWIGGQGPITRVRSIRLGTTVIYDWNGGAELGAALVWNGAIWAGQTRLTSGGNPTSVRVSPGTLTQPVDGAIRHQKGDGRWTNYPGKWIVALEIPDLTAFNNTLQRLSVEVEYTQTALADLIVEIGGWVGLLPGDFELSALAGRTCAKTDGEGFTVDTRRSAASILQEMEMVYDFDLCEENGPLTAKLHPQSAFAAVLSETDLRVQAGYDRGKPVADAPQKEADEQSLPFVQEFLFRDKKRDGATGYRTAYRFEAVTRHKATQSSTATLIGARGGEVARRLLAHSWAAARGRSGTLGLEYLTLAPGDEAQLTAPDGALATIISKITCPLFGPIPGMFKGFDPLVSGLPLPADTAGLERKTPIEPREPIVFAAALSLVNGDGFYTHTPAIIFGVCRGVGDLRYEGSVVRLQERAAGGTDWVERSKNYYDGEATIGELVAPFSPATDTALEGRVWGGSLLAAGAHQGAGVPNLMVFENGLLARFTNAGEITDSDPNSRLYNVSGVTGRLYGSDDFDDGSPLPAGMRFLMLCDEVGNWSNDIEWIGLPTPKSAINNNNNSLLGILLGSGAFNPTSSGPPGSLISLPGTVARQLDVRENHGNNIPVFWSLGGGNGENLRPPSPTLGDCMLSRSGGLTIYGAVRSRYYDDYDGQSIDHLDLSNGQGRFVVIVTQGGSSQTLEKTIAVASNGAFSFHLSAAEVTGLVGAFGPTVTGSLALYGTAGNPVQLGRPARFTADARWIVDSDGRLMRDSDGRFVRGTEY